MLILNKEDLQCLHCVKDEFIQWVFISIQSILVQSYVLEENNLSIIDLKKRALLVYSIPNWTGKWASYEIGYLKNHVS